MRFQNLKRPPGYDGKHPRLHRPHPSPGPGLSAGRLLLLSAAFDSRADLPCAAVPVLTQLFQWTP